tara:strand:+ start:4219 stop:4470 length:252 start_codon:yes stop_codon:yes gene_type:complete
MPPTEKEIAEEEKKRLVDYYYCFSTDTGQRVLKDLQKLYQDKSSIQENDVYGTYFHEGARYVYLLLRDNMERGEKLTNKGDDL